VSFILDALRKSEHERQRSAVPGVAQVPFAVRRRETPRWALVAIGLLGSAVLALGIAWWQTTRTGADREAAAGTAPIERPLGETAPPAARMTRVEPPRTQPSPDEPAPTTAARDAPAPSAVTPPPPAPRSSPAVADTAAAAPAPRSAPAIGGATAAAPTLPNAAALAAEGIAVPMLKLTLHVFSENPAERFVFINGTRYREGQTLREGPQVVSIERAGVVLSQQGRRFLLAPQ
jgi:general secretion pathway protein B